MRPTLLIGCVLSAFCGSLLAGAPVELLTNGGLEPPPTSLNKSNSYGTVKGLLPNGWSDNSNISPSHTDTVYAEEADNAVSGSALKITAAVQSGYGSGAHFQMYQGFPGVAGRSYTARAWLRATPDATVSFRIRQNVAPWAVRASTNCAVTGNWQPFAFSLAATSNETLRVDFEVGTPLTLWIDEVSLGLNDSQREWFVSPTGSDSNDGSRAAPYLTFTRAVQALLPGDTLWLRSGTYRETLTPLRSGAPGNPITFAAYPGETATLSGCDVVNGPWQTYSGPVQTTVATQRVMQLFANGRRMNLARYPDQTPDQNMLSYTNWTPTVTSSPRKGVGLVTFPAMPNQPDNYWVGGCYSGRNGTDPFTAARGDIIASTNNTITLTNLSYWWSVDVNAASAVGSGCGYIINHLNALDAPAEWYWGGSNLYFYPPTDTVLTQSVVEARTRLWGCNFSNQTDLVVEGLTFSAASLYLGGSSRCRATNCSLLFPAPWSNYTFTNNHDYGGPEDGSCGVYVSGTSNRVSRCCLAHSWGSGLRLEGTNNVLEDSLLEDINWLGRRMAPVQALGLGNSIVRNTLRRCAQAGIDGGNRTVGFQNVGYQILACSNLITDIGLLTADCGFFYINSQGDARPVNATVAYNTCLRTSADPFTMGIYFDNGTCGGSIHHNVVYIGTNCDQGIYLHNTAAQSDISVYNNTLIVGNGKATTCGGQFTSLSNIVFQNNLANRLMSGATRSDHNLTNASLSQFLNSANYDYHLNSGSPAIDAGVPIPGITDGYAGSAPDLGAYEFSLSPAFPPAPPALTVSNPSVIEGNRGTTQATFTLGLSPCPVPFVLDFATADGTAMAGTDYVATNGTLFFLPGQTNLSLTVTVIGATNVEPNETFYLNLSDVFGRVFSATATIVDDDSMADTDQDGLPDAWERFYFGSLQYGPLDDPDRDGRNNLQEYIAGTDPRLPDRPAALTVNVVNSNIQVGFFANAASGPGYAGLTRWFDLLACTNLASSLWSGVAGFTNLAGANQFVTCTNPIGPGACYKLQIRLQ